MCLPDQPPARPAPPAMPVPVSAADAVAMAQAALAFLANADMASVPAVVQAECLRGLERVESLHTAARAGTLAAFTAGGGYEDDGQGSAGAWLRWQTRVTSGGLLTRDVEVQAAACRERGHQGLELWRRGRF